MSRKRSKTPNEKEGNHPLGRLADLLRNAGVKISPANPPRPSLPPRPVPKPERVADAESPDQLFREAMQGVARPNWRNDSLPALLPTAVPQQDPELEDRRLLVEATSGDIALPIPDHPEYIEGWVGIAGRRFLPNLRNGVYSIQGSLDLHGLGRDAARAAVEQFIETMSRGRSCCVKIIHGRGINSPSATAILKEHLQRWLATRRMSHHVVAYASAPATDGGVGAVYVLLRPR